MPRGKKPYNQKKRTCIKCGERFKLKMMAVSSKGEPAQQCIFCKEKSRKPGRPLGSKSAKKADPVNKPDMYLVNQAVEKIEMKRRNKSLPEIKFGEF
jgi:hypothetical protein